MDKHHPLVTVLIASKDRHDDLRKTLRQLRGQAYPSIQMIVVDDASSTSLEPLVAQEWSDAIFVRKPNSAGQCLRRSEGFLLAEGQYVLQLDDDAAPINAKALEEAVRFMESRPEVGILSCYIFNGPDLPKQLPRAEAKYHLSFVGCGSLFRTTALRQVGGYQPFFGNEWEEEELCLRFLKAGWGIYFLPDVVIHHRVSPQNRRSDRTWMRGLRNKLWALVMHFPLSRLPFEMGWVLTVGLLDAIRMLRFLRFAQAILEFLGGLPRALSLRRPMSSLARRRYDALRFKAIRTKEEYDNPPRCGIYDFWGWYKAWWNRPRQRSFWDRRPGDTGRSPTVKFAHEFRTEPKKRP